MKTISTPSAPAAVGPYSQAVRAGNVLYCSGQVGCLADGTMIEGSVVEQAVQALDNLAAICRQAGTDLSQTAKTTIYLTDLKNYAAVNKVYGDRFGKWRPARATVEVSALPLGALVEIDAIVTDV